MRWGACLTALVLLLLTGCSQQPDMSGCWVTDNPQEYYFQLYEDGSCMMFNADDEWVSSGTYTAAKDHIAFRTDTGSFVWAWDEEHEAMCFDAGSAVYYYRLQD